MADDSQNQEPVPIFFDEDDIEAIYARRLKFVEDAWGKATAYDAAITVAGYGAFFALWSGTAKDLTPSARATVAALMGVSLLLYITWHIVMMLARHRYDRQLSASILKAQPPLDAINEWERIEAQRVAFVGWFQRWLWAPVFGASVVTGFGGALLLIYNCLAVGTGKLPKFPS